VKRTQLAIAAAILAALGIAALAAPLFAADPLAQIPGANLLGGSLSHPFGTDELNRDVFARALYGLRIDLLIAFGGVAAGALAGIAIGALGSMHRFADTAAQRLFDTVLAFPALILGITLAAVLGPGSLTVGIVVAIAEAPLFGRLTRTTILRVREEPYVEVARAAGAGRWWVMRQHVLPNSLAPLATQAALSLSLAVFIEGALSFIGLGVRPPDPSLGSIVAASMSVLSDNPMHAAGPLALITLLTVAFGLIPPALAARR
jgi:peptide/nickel transport system permease protein